MRVGGALACACLVAALLAAPTQAADNGADPQRLEVQPPTASAIAFLPGSNGYLLGIEVPHPRVALLYAIRLGFDPEFHFSMAAYAVRTRPTVKKGVIKARFGDIANVSLRFVPSGSRRTRPAGRGCDGPRRVTQRGHFQGRIVVRGEDGFIRASARRVEGALRRSFRLRCQPGAARRPDPLLTSYLLPQGRLSFGDYNARLEAVSDAGGRTVGLMADHEEGGGPGASVEANASEWKDGMLIYRAVAVGGDAGTLLTSPPGARPAEATLKPPRPFRGEASFLELSPTSHSWAGSLAVRLPGLDVPLTGPGFATSLCVATLLKDPDGCSLADPKPVVPERLMRQIGRLR